MRLLPGILVFAILVLTVGCGRQPTVVQRASGDVDLLTAEVGLRIAGPGHVQVALRVVRRLLKRSAVLAIWRNDIQNAHKFHHT